MGSLRVLREFRTEIVKKAHRDVDRGIKIEDAGGGSSRKGWEPFFVVDTDRPFG